jgi:hypothetical protein
MEANPMRLIMKLDNMFISFQERIDRVIPVWIKTLFCFCAICFMVLFLALYITGERYEAIEVYLTGG